MLVRHTNMSNKLSQINCYMYFLNVANVSTPGRILFNVGNLQKLYTKDHPSKLIKIEWSNVSKKSLEIIIM